MKFQQLILLAGLSFSVMLTSCDKDEVVPAIIDKPTDGTTNPPGGGTTNPGGGNTNPGGGTTNPGGGGTTTPPPVTTSSLLTSMGGREFKYDSQNRLARVDFSMQPYLGFSILYEGNKPVRINRDTGGWLIYVYDGDKVSEVLSYYTDNGKDNFVNYHYKFEYSGDRLVKVTTMSYARSDAGQYGEQKMKYDANGNMVEMETRWSTSNRAEDLTQPSYIYWANFDTKPNPMPYVEDGIYLPGIKFFQNNPGYRDTGGGKEFFTYLYHDSGMPMQRYLRLEAYPHIQPEISKYTYK